MLALRQPSNLRDTCTVNVLPCRIHHDGPTKVTKRYWAPVAEKDSTRTSHFRGRRLRGRVLKLPEAYRGVIVKSTEELLAQPSTKPQYMALDDDEDIQIRDEEDEPPEPVKVLDELSSFDEVVVWGHDQLPALDDPFVKGVEEWIAFAEALHGSKASALDHNAAGNGAAESVGSETAALKS